MRDFKAFLRWLIRWSPAFAIGAVGTWAVINFGWLAPLWFILGVLKILVACAVFGVVGTAIIIGAVLIFELSRRWIYED